MKYIKPEINIAKFAEKDIVTTSSPTDNIFKSYDSSTTYSATAAVDVSAVLEMN